MGPLAALIIKELRVELRSKEALLASMLVGLLVLVTFRIGFSLQETEPDSTSLVAGIVWSAVVFAGLGVAGNAYQKERDRHTLEVLQAAPIPRAHVYLGKFIGNLTLLLVVEAVILTSFFVLFSNPFEGDLASLVLLALLGGLGYAAVATLMARVAAEVEGGWLILPLLVLPVVAKTIVEMCVAATTYLIAGNTAQFNSAVTYLALFDLAFVIGGLLAAEYI